MPSLANLVLNDGTANVTFTSIGRKNGGTSPFMFVNQASGVRTLASRIEIGHRSRADGTYRATFKYVQPIIRAKDGVDTQVGSSIYSTEGVVLSPLATTAERTVGSNIFKNLLASAFVTSMLINAEGIVG